MYKDSLFYPDANNTIRISYGTVQGYEPADGVIYQPFSSLKGLIQKKLRYGDEKPDYQLPDTIIALYHAKEYGRFAKNNKMPVAFLTNMHTTGGYSGSPVLNANGELVGINFDRTREGITSDYAYNPNLCRNIVLDIRFVLFLMEKYAGASHLIKEMKLKN